MNQGTVFQEDGFYKIILKLGVDGWPIVKRFSSLEGMLSELQAVSAPYSEVMDFVFAGLQSRGTLRELPGSAADWRQFAR